MYSREKLYIVYALRCKNNGRLYIGRTSNIENRIQVHFQELKSGRHTNKLMLQDFEKYEKMILKYISWKKIFHMKKEQKNMNI